MKFIKKSSQFKRLRELEGQEFTDLANEKEGAYLEKIFAKDIET